MLRLKFATGFVVIPIVLVLFYHGGWPLFLVALAFMLVGLQELYSALPERGIYPVREAGWLGAIGIFAATQWAPPELRFGMVTACIVAAVFVALVAQLRDRQGESVIANVGATIFGVIYVGLLLSYLLRLRQLPLHGLEGIPEGGVRDRMGVIFLVFASIWVMDTVANVVGRYFGTKRPWPNISPNKTWEGSLSGLLAALVLVVVVGGICRLPTLNMLVLGVLVGVFGQIGDFCESLLKRDLGLKDFGALLPGHGGVLDRFDSLGFSMPLAYYYLQMLLPPT